MTQQLWNEKTGKIIHAIIFYCLLLVVQAGLDLYQYSQIFNDLSRARGLSDLMSALFGAVGPEDIIVTVLLLAAYIWLVSAIKRFGSVQEDLQTELSLRKVGSALWLNFAASVVGMIPLVGWVSLIMEICSYVMMVSAFRFLMSSPVFNAVARGGAGTLKSYAVWSIWGIIPFIGGLFRLIAWIQFIRGWSNMRGGSPVVAVVPQNNVSVNVHYANPQLPTDEYLNKASAKTDEELKVILQHKTDYHPQLVKAAENVLLDRITGVAQPAIVTPVNDEDKHKSYQPTAYKPTCEEEKVQVPVKAKDDSFDVVKESWKSEVKEDARPVATSQPKEADSPIAEKSKANHTVLFSILAGVLLAVGGALTYFLWYVPYATDRDAPRTYVVANNVFLRSSQIAGVEYNVVGKVSYGSEVITYNKFPEWAEVKVDGQEGFIASAYLLDSLDFNLLNGVWGDNDAKECIESSKCRLAILDYYKTNRLQSGATGWQIYTRMKDQKPNTVFYPRIYNKNSKFTDFVFILKNVNEEGKRIVVGYSFEDETEAPIFRFAVWAPTDGYIQNILPVRDGVSIVFDNGVRTKVDF